MTEGDLAGFRVALVEREIRDPAELVGIRLDNVELAPEVGPESVDRAPDFGGVFGHKEDRIPRPGAGRLSELGALVVRQELCDRPFRLLRQHEICDAGKTERLPRFDRFIEETARSVGRARCNDCSYDVAS